MLRGASQFSPVALISSSLVNLILLSSMVINFAHCTGVDHCYSDLGCFPQSEQFFHPRHRPFRLRPWHRKRIKTQFEIYNRHHPEGFMLSPWDRRNLLLSGFDPKLETKIIIPGWLDSIKRTFWFRRMKDAFQYHWRPVNLIIVYWQNFTPYTIATSNTRVVGAELANLIKFLERECGYDRSYYHIIGHSLGAHIGGYAGDRLPGLGRITALDPARPFFQHMPKSVRLDRGDANFVDAIHSDFTPENAIFLLMSFGMTTPVGHVDFYPNGPPLLQPGCLKDTLMSVRNGIQRGLLLNSLSIAFLESLRYLTACDHQRSHEWFIESILNRQCVFVGVRCNEFEGMINGRCTCDDSPSACAIMGIHADQMFMHNLHNDPWPRGFNRPLARPLVVPSNPRGKSHNFIRYKRMFEELPGSRRQDDAIGDGQQATANRDQLYAQLRAQSDQLRQTGSPVPIQEHDPPFEQLNEMQDSLFIDYLKSNFDLHNQHNQPLPRPFAAPIPNQEASEMVDLRPASSDIDSFMANHQATSHDHNQFNYLFHNQAQYPFNQHPKLMSDVDRDIEDWYENTSRWYLKTNNRPDYCVNQYQVLVYLGPLRSSNGKEKLRANLLISIIGSRGQLVNQRFVPRGSQLDSFTMQPFFILLEGSYSLGNILSVAIGWEARYDPDPIQATVSFESNLLSSLESVLPSYKAKHPWLSETLKYDHSRGFRWNQQQQQLQPPRPSILSSKLASNLLSNIGINIEQRTGLISQLPDLIHDLETAASDQSQCQVDGKLKKLDGQCSAKPHGRMDDLLTLDSLDLEDVDEGASVEVLADADLDASAAISQHQMVEYMQPALQQLPPIIKQQQQQQQREPLLGLGSAHISAELHNIHLHEQPEVEDSIVINEVVISPLQASYGKFGPKTSKTFCPPHRAFHLRRDQTVKLVPNLVGKCNQVVGNFQHMHRYRRNPPHPRPRPQQPQALRAM